VAAANETSAPNAASSSSAREPRLSPATRKRDFRAGSWWWCHWCRRWRSAAPDHEQDAQNDNPNSGDGARARFAVSRAKRRSNTRRPRASSNHAIPSRPWDSRGGKQRSSRSGSAATLGAGPHAERAADGRAADGRAADGRAPDEGVRAAGEWRGKRGTCRKRQDDRTQRPRRKSMHSGAAGSFDPPADVGAAGPARGGPGLLSTPPRRRRQAGRARDRARAQKTARRHNAETPLSGADPTGRPPQASDGDAGARRQTPRAAEEKKTPHEFFENSQILNSSVRFKVRTTLILLAASIFPPFFSSKKGKNGSGAGAPLGTKGEAASEASRRELRAKGRR
jgi:hypothetical protein